MVNQFPSYPYDVKYMGELRQKAITLADNCNFDLENIETIVEGR